MPALDFCICHSEPSDLEVLPFPLFSCPDDILCDGLDMNALHPFMSVSADLMVPWAHPSFTGTPCYDVSMPKCSHSQSQACLGYSISTVENGSFLPMLWVIRISHYRQVGRGNLWFIPGARHPKQRWPLPAVPSLNPNLNRVLATSQLMEGKKGWRWTFEHRSCSRPRSIRK